MDDGPRGSANRLDTFESLMEYVNDRRIAIEICLTSNVQTRAAADFASHPLRRYYDMGLNVVLNLSLRTGASILLVERFDPHPGVRPVVLVPERARISTEEMPFITP